MVVYSQHQLWLRTWDTKSTRIYGTSHLFFLVGGWATPKNMSSSVGMTETQDFWKHHPNVPNHQASILIGFSTTNHPSVGGTPIHGTLMFLVPNHQPVWKIPGNITTSPGCRRGVHAQSCEVGHGHGRIVGLRWYGRKDLRSGGPWEIWKNWGIHSDKHTKCYWKWPFIVDLSMEYGVFSIVMLVYQRVPSAIFWCSIVII